MRRHRSVIPLVLAIAGFFVACGGDETGPNAQTSLSYDSINLAADPCADFERFACGKFRPQFPSDTGTGSVFEDLQIDRLRTLYTATIYQSKQLDQDRSTQLVQRWLDDCRASFASGEPEPLAALLSNVKAGSASELAQLVAASAREGYSVLFGTSLLVGADGKWELELTPAGFGLSPERMLDPDGEAVRAAYRAHIKKLSDVERQPVDSEAVWRIEANLAVASPTDDEASEPLSLYQTVDRSSLSALVPGFDWDAYFAAATPSGAPARVVIVAPAYFAALASVLRAESVDAIASYARWRAIERYADTQGKTARAEEFAFHAKALGGQTGDANDDPESSCFFDAYDSLSYAMGQIWLQRNPALVVEQDAAQARALVSDVRRGLESRLRETPWVDAPTLAAALAKLAQLEEHVGFQSRSGSSYVGLDLPSRRSRFGNVRALARYYGDGRFAAIGTAVNRTAAWPLAPADVNAAYLPSYNVIAVPSGILGKPLFSATANAAANYGAMGAIVGHELTHALDNHGRAFGPTGALGNWWSDAADAAFRDQAQCLVDEYDRFEALPGKTVDGILTLGENMADLGGLLSAYRALEASGEVVPEWNGLSRDQQFFLAYAQSHCEVPDKARLPQRLRDDPHSPARFRINGVLANVPEFARAFSCAPGRPMAPVDACRVW